MFVACGEKELKMLLAIETGDSIAGAARKIDENRETIRRVVNTLSEGDRVRISLGKPGEYNGQKTVAVTSDSAIIALDG